MSTRDKVHDSYLAIPWEEFPDPATDVPADATGQPQVTVLAGGCFWCVEAVFKELDGVIGLVPGYIGGAAETAEYEAVCSGQTEHAEAVRITFDPRRITYGQLLKVFFSVAHDPTQKDRQGADTGRQYRSAIFYADEEQQRVAEAYLRQLSKAGVYHWPIVTEVQPLRGFYEAEEYHRDYAARNPWQPYILVTALPRVMKVREHFGRRKKKDRKKGDAAHGTRE
jgi:peptide-methionine (S)-S-oxide reductase